MGLVESSNDIVEGSDLIGIKNGGNSCYIASSLQILALMLRQTQSDAMMHWELCPMDPLECILCQLLKIVSFLHAGENAESIRVDDFLCIFYKEFMQFERGI